MPKFIFYSTIDDWWSILRSVLRHHQLSFAISKPHLSNNCDYFTDITEQAQQQILISSRTIYLIGPEFSSDLLALRKQSVGKNAGNYFIDEARGGPSIAMRMSPQFEEGGMTWFGDASLSILKTYRHAESGEIFPFPPKLKDAFLRVAQTIRGQLKIVVVNETDILVSPRVLDLFEAGKAGVPLGGKCFSAGGELQPPTPWQYGAKAPAI